MMRTPTIHPHWPAPRDATYNNGCYCQSKNYLINSNARLIQYTLSHWRAATERTKIALLFDPVLHTRWAHTSMNAEIISIGTELLLGEIVDTNTAHIARNLREIGLDLFFTTTVGDNLGRITQAIDAALDRADVIITTGGLGPTVDDMTRQAVANATGRGLVFQQNLFDQIADRFRRLGSLMSDNNRQQAYIPAGAIPIENPVGTAPCFIVESERGTVISLPGVPSEMKYLLDAAVLPYLQRKFSLTSIIKARVLRTAGIGESTVDSAITDLMKLTNPTVGLAAHIGQTDIRITAKADSPELANRMIAEVETEIRRRVGEYIYGAEKDKIEEALVRELRQRGLTIAVFEAGIGSKLYDRLCQVPGGADLVASATQYDTADALCAEIGLNPNADPEALGETAVQHLHESSQAQICISILSRPDATVIAVLTPKGIKTRVYRLGDRDARPAIWASTWGMALAWHWLRNQSPATA